MRWQLPVVRTGVVMIAYGRRSKIFELMTHGSPWMHITAFTCSMVSTGSDGKSFSRKKKKIGAQLCLVSFFEE